MAEISYLHIHEEEEEEEDDVVSTLDSVLPFSSLGFDTLSESPFSNLTLRPRPQITTVDWNRLSGDISDSDSDLIDRENQVNFVTDLFHQRVEQSLPSRKLLSRVSRVFSDPNFEATEIRNGKEEAGSNILEPDLELGLGLGFCLDRHEETSSNNMELDLDLGSGFCLDSHDLAQEDDNSGFMVANCGDDFLVTRRDSVSESGESSTMGGDKRSSNNAELDLDLGLGLCLDSHGLAQEDDNSGFMVANRGDDFFITRRDSVSESGESSTMGDSVENFAGVMRVLGIGSDSDQDENNDAVGTSLNAEDHDDDDTNLRLCWDSFELEDHGDVNGDFGWEEIGGSADEREALSMFFETDVDEDLDASVSAVIPSEEEVVVERLGVLRNVEWEVLLNLQHLDPNLEHLGLPNLGDVDEYNYTTEYEMLFGQFAENESSSLGRPPASKTVVRNLQSVVLTQEDVENNNALCAICKDEISVGEKAKQLPCSHRYHGDCIVPWLGIRNTCPLCRFELPTDDSDYEWRKTQRADRIQ